MGKARLTDQVVIRITPQMRQQIQQAEAALDGHAAFIGRTSNILRWALQEGLRIIASKAGSL